MGLSYPAEYILSEAKLAHGRAEEDLEALALLGVTAEWLDEFKQEIDAAEALPDIGGTAPGAHRADRRQGQHPGGMLYLRE